MLPFLRCTSRRCLLAILGTATLSGAALGQDALPRHLGRASQVVIPQARAFALETRDRGVEIESVGARVAILEGTAATTLDIALHNPSARRVEAVLLLPVPAGAVEVVKEGAPGEGGLPFGRHRPALRPGPPLLWRSVKATAPSPAGLRCGAGGRPSAARHRPGGPRRLARGCLF